MHVAGKMSAKSTHNQVERKAYPLPASEVVVPRFRDQPCGLLATEHSHLLDSLFQRPCKHLASCSRARCKSTHKLDVLISRSLQITSLSLPSSSRMTKTSACRWGSFAMQSRTATQNSSRSRPSLGELAMNRGSALQWPVLSNSELSAELSDSLRETADIRLRRRKWSMIFRLTMPNSQARSVPWPAY